jgi:hypothetical protein
VRAIDSGVADYFVMLKRKVLSMKRSITLIAICLGASALFAPADARGTKRVGTASGSAPSLRATDEASWEGTYAFSENPGRNAGPGPMIAEHTIVIYKRGDKLIADIDADGYQTVRRLRCDAKISGSRITFYFNGYREENVFTPYKKGQMLLAFESATVHGRTRMLTYWGAYQPIFRSLKTGRIYFGKVK